MSNKEFKSSAWQTPASAATYDKNTRAAPAVFQLIRHDFFIKYVQRHAAPGAKILDLGCGSGLVSIALHDLGYRVVSCDVSQAMLDQVAESRGDREFELRVGSGFEIPAADGEFDLVLSRMMIQHFVDWPAILAEKARVVREGGIVLFDFGNQEHLDATKPEYDDGKGFPYNNDPAEPESYYAVATEEEMARQAKRVGLEVVGISPLGLLLCNGFQWNALKSTGIADQNQKLDDLLKSPEARELLELIELQLMPLLPKSVTYGNMTVLRRSERSKAPGVSKPSVAAEPSGSPKTKSTWRAAVARLFS